MTTSSSISSQDDVKFPEAWPGSRFILRTFMLFTSRLKIIGATNFPKSQFLVTSNHLSFMDVPAITTAMGQLKVAAFAAKKYKGTWLEPLFHLGSPVWVEQESADRQALMAAIKLVKAGYNFGIAPEGHRSKTGKLLKGNEGAAFLASRMNLPIVPLAISGTEKVLRRLRPKVTVVIGKPYRLPEGRAKGDMLAAYTERIMCALAALLPEARHGYYAGNPLIEEMAALVRPNEL